MKYFKDRLTCWGYQMYFAEWKLIHMHQTSTLCLSAKICSDYHYHSAVWNLESWSAAIWFTAWCSKPQISNPSHCLWLCNSDSNLPLTVCESFTQANFQSFSFFGRTFLLLSSFGIWAFRFDLLNVESLPVDFWIVLQAVKLFGLIQTPWLVTRSAALDSV